MKTIEQIKKECIEVDKVHLGTNGFGNENEIINYYKDISIKKLLIIYSNYMGLKCLVSDGESLEEHGYTINILDLIEYL